VFRVDWDELDARSADEAIQVAQSFGAVSRLDDASRKGEVTGRSRVDRARLLNHSELLGRFNNTGRRPGWR
jgi:hypothetical protein